MPLPILIPIGYGVVKLYQMLTKESEEHAQALVQASQFKIAMLGGRRVGKTSALASMYECFQEVADASNLTLGIDETEVWTKLKIEERRNFLRQGAEDPTDGGVEGDGVVNKFLFYLTEKRPSTKASQITIQFIDHPGTFLDGVVRDADTDKQNMEEMKQNLAESHAILIGIDTPYLMERNGEFHDERNRPQQIAQILDHIYSRGPRQHLIVLVPLRCEKYVQSAPDRRDLLLRVRQGYRELLTVCAKDYRRDQIRIVTTPVQTTGSLSFDHFKYDRQRTPPAVAEFTKISAEAKYSPKHSDQPLRHLMHHAVKRLADARDSTFWGSFEDTSSLRSSVGSFAAGIKHSDGFEIIQTGGF